MRHQVKEWDSLGLNVFFLETPLRMDDVKEIGRLHEQLQASGTATKIAYGEWQVMTCLLLWTLFSGEYTVTYSFYMILRSFLTALNK